MFNYSEAFIAQSWFIPIDILALLSIIIIITLSIIYLSVIIFDKTCHSIPMLLVANTCLVQLVLAIDLLGNAIFRLQNDLKQIQYTDYFCVLRGYLAYCLCAVQNYSYLLQSFHRFVLVLYPTKLFWQTKQTQLILISTSWLFGLLFPLSFLLDGQVLYSIDDQICQIPLGVSVAIPVIIVCVYLIPISMMVSIYLKIVHYVHQMNKRMTGVNTLVRARKELKMIRRTILLLAILAAIEFPYALFIFMAFFTTPPRYHFRIAWLFVDVSSLVVMIVLCYFTDPLKTSLKNKLDYKRNTVVPSVIRL